MSQGVRSQSPKKIFEFGHRGPLEKLLFTSITDLLLEPANKAFNAYRNLVTYHKKAQLLHSANIVIHESVHYCIILSIKRFDIALKHFHFKVRKTWQEHQSYNG